ncbi:MAG: carboxylating nicotinate-nucleotide diphosphorylase [Anaerolineales bacterium]|uniref:Probable nicotinate-nucleotide pyrophosphorylase [carboxylating] n=1 Tax=Candidatus Desulfolinea nitratireducens TaxID=2841698 RepID=A0A8J6NIM6_9CHLR|nr:carboxylating nicotinate-nucleotide diphosphorylase [Candidatus Desulfolinea nitratireducens]MBL6960107.1 carboxylating nicotinate-nucleotide diphosphorylase [Anaerolineales bacterium]
MNNNSLDNKIYSHLPKPLRHFSVVQTVELALAEDLSADGDLEINRAQLASKDITSAATLDADVILHGKITAKASGIIAGLDLAAVIFKFVDPKIEFSANVQDGQQVEPGTVLAELSGPGVGMLAAERTALNFVGRISGIATLTRKYVDTVAGTNATILDTRKTAPGLRVIDKYAVLMGGGENHRMGLHDMILIKDNHIDGAGGIAEAVAGVRQQYGTRYLIEVEVKDLDELNEALSLLPERIMLDNMSLDMMRQAVEITKGRVQLEASGNVSLETVRGIAQTGVDFISVGALTHSVPVFDISMRMVA